VFDQAGNFLSQVQHGPFGSAGPDLPPKTPKEMGHALAEPVLVLVEGPRRIARGFDAVSKGDESGIDDVTGGALDIASAAGAARAAAGKTKPATKMAVVQKPAGHSPVVEGTPKPPAPEAPAAPPRAAAPPAAAMTAEKGLSNAQVRAWYAERVRGIDTSGPLTRENAMRVHEERNSLKAEARSMMADRAAAAELDKNQPLRPFEYYEQKYSEQGFSGETLWQRIIQGGTTPNPDVNAAHGVK
jgi:hypothetical protein